MFYVYTIIMFLFFSFSSFIFMTLTGNKEVFVPVTIIGICLSFLTLIIGFFNNLTNWNQQIDNFEEIRKYQKYLKLKQSQFEDLKKEWIKYLSVEYPNFEKDIFEKMTPNEKNDLQMYFVKYPELTSSTLFNKLIDNITKKSNEIYDINENLVRTVYHIKTSSQNPWNIIRPKIPQDISNFIEKE